MTIVNAGTCADSHFTVPFDPLLEGAVHCAMVVVEASQVRRCPRLDQAMQELHLQHRGFEQVVPAMPDDNKDGAIHAIADQLDPLVRRLSSNNDNEVIAAAHLLLGKLAAAGLDIHDFTQRVVHRGFSESEVQQIHDAAYTKGVADGREQGRRSAVLRDATPALGVSLASDVGPRYQGL